MIKITAAGTFPDAWKEVCLIGIIPEDGSEIQFAGFTEDITAFDWGDKDIEGMPLVNAGRVKKFNPMGDESVTMKVYAIKADDATAEAIVQLFHKQSTADTSQPIVVDNTVIRQNFGVIILWANTLPATAGAVPASVPAYRIQIINATMISYKPNYDDKLLSAEITFKWTPFQKDASANKREESTDGSELLPAAITTATSF